MTLSNRTLARLPFFLLLAVILLYIIFPFYWAFRSSITPNSELFQVPVTYWPSNPTLEHYQQVFTDQVFLRALLNSTIVAGSELKSRSQLIIW